MQELTGPYPFHISKNHFISVFESWQCLSLSYYINQCEKATRLVEVFLSVFPLRLLSF